MSTTTTTRLAAKQKRALDWRSSLKEVQDAGLRRQIEEDLKLYSALLLKCWETKEITSEDEFRIEDLERRLQQQNEESRLRVVGKKPVRR